MVSLALFDDYPEPGLGHHPSYLLGLAEAATRLGVIDPPTRLYCPATFVAELPIPPGTVHQPFRKAQGDQRQRRAAVAALCRDAQVAGARVFINLFLDENHDSFFLPPNDLRFAHVLHRPAELADQLAAGDKAIAAFLSRIAPGALFVVHTPAARRRARDWLPDSHLLQLSWPAASIAELTERFAVSAPAPGEEPYVLLIGDARDAKGVHELLAALEPQGPMLKIVGQQPPRMEENLRHRYPRSRITWETGWVPRARLNDAIAGAAVVVFPYLPSFGRHGGVSGALAHALTFGKPIVASTILADQLPASAANLLVCPGDLPALRQAIDWAVRHSKMLHESAKVTFSEVRERHTYDVHLERIIQRMADLADEYPSPGFQGRSVRLPGRATERAEQPEPFLRGHERYDPASIDVGRVKGSGNRRPRIVLDQ